MRRTALDRRTVLKMTAAGAASLALAGCTSDSGSGGGGSGGDGDGSGGDTDDSGGNTGDSYDFDGWFDDVENYDGVVDETGSDEVTVAVGAEGNGGGFAFDPAAVEVDSGTTVVWEWTGDGGGHNVVDADGAFGSDTVSEAGHTFEHTFEESGTFRYSCEPHEAMGMKGAIVVK